MGGHYREGRRGRRGWQEGKKENKKEDKKEDKDPIVTFYFQVSLR